MRFAGDVLLLSLWVNMWFEWTETIYSGSGGPIKSVFCIVYGRSDAFGKVWLSRRASSLRLAPESFTVSYERLLELFFYFLIVAAFSRGSSGVTYSYAFSV